MAAARPTLTRSSFERLKLELEALQTKRLEVIEEVKLTRSYGDLRENAGYHAAREAYGIIEGQIKSLEDKLENAVVMADNATLDEVMPGVPVTVRVDGTEQHITYTVVDGAERNLVDNGISSSSPLGEALLYTRIGDDVEAETPRGVMRFTVVHIGD